MVFAKLVFIFVCTIGDTSYPIALVQAYDRPTGQHRRKDKDLGFYRIQGKPRNMCEFISIHTIIRGALLSEDYEKPGDFLVMDVIDTDMFLRMKSLQFWQILHRRNLLSSWPAPYFSFSINLTHLG